MLREKQIKATRDMQLPLWLFLGFLLVTLCFSWVRFSICVNRLEHAAQGLSLVDYLNSSAQRLIKLELMGGTNDELTFIMDTTLEELKPELGTPSEYFSDHTDILQGIADVSTDWAATRDTLEAFRDNGDAGALLSVSERLFYHTAILTNASSDYISELSVTLLRLQLIIILQLAVAAVIIGHRLFCTLMELKRNRELAATMFIDSATGIFNRSKCHEVLRSAVGVNQKSRAMIVFDLNDLKKTNDQHGHRIGDELIYNFAQIINQGTRIHPQEAFVGRYGGDEFMVFYNSIEEDDVRLYLEEVAFLAEAFNEKESRYQVSYAVGHALLSAEEQDKTLRQLFDIADQAMYANKSAMKQKRAEEASAAGLTPTER